MVDFEELLAVAAEEESGPYAPLMAVQRRFPGSLFPHMNVTAYTQAEGFINRNNPKAAIHESVDDPSRALLEALAFLLKAAYQRGYLVRYSKPHVIEKKKSPRAASNASS